MSIEKEEYASRLAQIRRGMKQENLDVLLVYSWKRGQLHYVTGYTPNYIANVGMAVLTHDHDPILYIRFPFDLERAQSDCWFGNVQASGDVSDLGRDAAFKLRELGFDRCRIGLVSGDRVIDEFPWNLYGQLTADLPGVEIIDAKNLMKEIRMIKTPAEFEMLRQAARVADASIDQAGESLAPGISELAVIAQVEQVARESGAANYLAAIAGKADRELIGPPENKPIEFGAPVTVEVAVQIEGYWSQVAKTFVAGESSRQQSNIHRAVYRAYRAAVDAAWPGNTLDMVRQAAFDVLEDAGYADYVEHDMGHGIGVDMPEPPNFIADADLVIREGMSLVIHPSVRVPNAGGAFVGGTVLITRDGPLPINDIPEP